MTEIISRDTATNAGLARYFTGEPCRHGHTCERYTSNSRCVECSNAANNLPCIRDLQRAYRARPETKYADEQYVLRKRRVRIASLPPPIKAGHCDLCQRARALHWDHDHKLEAQGFSALECHRGWLCFHCNTGLGKLGDDAAGLQRALDYVKGLRK